MPFSKECEDHGHVRLAIEQDPLEALKLGTYVGSCLGLGGICDYSAAAVVLDINKQVIYARDGRGNVVARQLLAISEDDKLVCFEVYPLSVDSGIKQLFADCDREFAEVLGLAIYQVGRDEKYMSNERDYDVAHILSHNWWDDSAWDLTVESDEDDEDEVNSSRQSKKRP